MATPTKAKQVKAAREANAQTATSQEIFEAIQKHGAIIQAGEILEATAKHIGADEIGRMLAEVTFRYSAGSSVGSSSSPAMISVGVV